MFRLEFKKDNNSKKYEGEAICNSKIYIKELDNDYHLLDFYYLVL